ncbi:MAG TPA: DUF2799 domain-containing protein [Gammaproteobacteria bacterium]
MSADQCATADWRSLGFQDGARGETLGIAERRDNACLEHGYVMDRTSYDEGRHAGLGQYCTTERAYALGESGRSYNGVCSAHNEEAFLASYNRGLDLYAFTSAVTTAESKLKSARDRHDYLDGELDKYSDGYRDENLSMEEHNNLVLNLWSERRYLEEEAIPYWIFAHRFLDEQLTEYRNKIEYGDLSADAMEPRAFPGPEPHDGPTTADAQAMLREVLSSLQQ